MGLWVLGLGFRVMGIGFWVLVFGLRAEGSWFMVHYSWFMVHSSWSRDQISGFGVQGSKSMGQNWELSVQGLGFGVNPRPTRARTALQGLADRSYPAGGACRSENGGSECGLLGVQSVQSLAQEAF